MSTKNANENYSAHNSNKNFTKYAMGLHSLWKYFMTNFIYPRAGILHIVKWKTKYEVNFINFIFNSFLTSDPYELNVRVEGSQHQNSLPKSLITAGVSYFLYYCAGCINTRVNDKNDYFFQ